jgi:hypothetical protein
LEKELETEFEKQSSSGSLKAGLIVCAVLVVILAISSLVLFMRVNSLQNEVDYLERQLNEARFNFYYVLPADQKFGVYDLEGDLYGLEWLHPYEEGVFDCSEMSACLERELENKGWNTLIILGDSPFGGGYHAWILVETEEEGYMPIETTTMEIVWWDNPNFDNYFIYDYQFEDILDALDHDETDFDWWK